MERSDAVRRVVGVGAVGAILMVASGATAAGGSDRSGLAQEVQRLQATWGNRVVASASALADTQTILVRTPNRSLLQAPDPARWLGSSFRVVVTLQNASGVLHTTPDNACSGSGGAPMRGAAPAAMESGRTPAR